MASITDFLATRKPEEKTGSGRRTVAVETAKAFLAMGVQVECQKQAEVIAAYLHSEGHSKNSDASSAARHVIAMYECLALLVKGETVKWIDGQEYTLHRNQPAPNLAPAPGTGPAGKGGNIAGTK